MDKKTKLWLGAGIVGVGAYLLWKSKQTAAPAVAPAAAANMVGFLPVGERMISAEGAGYAGVGDNEKFNATGQEVGPRMISQNGNQYSKEFYDVQDSKFANQTGNGNQYSQEFFDVKGGKLGVESGIFKKPMSDKKPLVGEDNMDTPRTKFNQSGPVKLKSKKYGDKTTTIYWQDLGGEFVNGSGVDVKGSSKLVNRPSNAAQLVGANGAPTFFGSVTAKYGPNQGVFAPSGTFFSKPIYDELKRKSPVEPTNPAPVMMTQKAPINNMVGLINDKVAVESKWINR
jgi:hypothetical protein